MQVQKTINDAKGKEFAQETENLVLQAGAAKASSTNIFSTISTPAKASSTNLVNTVYQLPGASWLTSHTRNSTVVNVSPIPTSRMISSHPSALILGDPTSTVQTRSKIGDYAGAKSLPGNTTTRGLSISFFSWQETHFLAMCKKAPDHSGYCLLPEAEYVAAASCFGQVLWIQN
ncbi:hypothetical protein Tco_1273407 [Tanacetum coccineum]